MAIISRHNILADAVLSLVEYNAPDDIVWRLEPYKNGRENGWKLTNNSDMSCVFSENRNSDDVVLYCSSAYNFSMQGNVPTDTIYSARKFFQSVEEAAKAIIAYLLETDVEYNDRKSKLNDIPELKADFDYFYGN